MTPVRPQIPTFDFRPICWNVFFALSYQRIFTSRFQAAFCFCLAHVRLGFWDKSTFFSTTLPGNRTEKRNKDYLTELNVKQNPQGNRLEQFYPHIFSSKKSSALYMGCELRYINMQKKRGHILPFSPN